MESAQMENHPADHTSHMVEGENSPREYFKFALVILGIALLSWWLTDSFGSEFEKLEYARWFMGVFFVTFASFKLIGYKMFALMFAGYDVVAKRFKPYAYAYPLIELMLGVLYLANRGGVQRDLLTIIIMAIGSIGVVQELKKRSGIHCACLGNIIKLPLSTVSLVEDVGMGLMAVWMAVAA